MSQQAYASAQPPFPQEVYQYAGMYNLGNPVAVHKVAFRSPITLGIISVLLAGLFGAVALFGDSSSATVLFMVLLTLLCVAGAVYYLAVFPVQHSAWRIYACTDGFLFMKGSNPIPCRWDQVAFVWQRIIRHYRNGIYTGTSYKYTVQRADGVKIVLTEMFRKVNQLGEQIQREVTSRLAPQALAAINAGQTLSFGPFNLSRQGLATSKGMIPWSEAQQVSANRGLVMIQRRGQSRGAPYGGVDKVPNLYVFLFVADALVKGQ
ncbi:MAG TPA: DUF6585 family protein [Ktedonobacterales bacterium]|nr:DUF6585 family protein [Ktedonobacterales bacterium]